MLKESAELRERWLERGDCRSGHPCKCQRPRLRFRWIRQLKCFKNRRTRIGLRFDSWHVVHSELVGELVMRRQLATQFGALGRQLIRKQYLHRIWLPMLFVERQLLIAVPQLLKPAIVPWLSIIHNTAR